MLAEERPLMKSAMPIGMKLLAIFFAFGACMCALTIGLLLFPGGALDSFWRLNPEAHAVFERIGGLSFLVIAIVGVACALAAIGLARNAKWGRWLGILILAANLVGDLTNAFVRHDLRTLIGVPIAGAMIFYLAKLEPQMTKKGRR
jgi:apolipoprotein N-acyltransferase